jgi:predicted O-linked N-acetylglucosamine transferase (SPINDLY family)
MTKLGFGHFVVETAEEYVALATKLASNERNLKEYRTELEQAITSRPWGALYAHDFYEKVIGFRA